MDYPIKLVLDETRRRRLDQVRTYLSMSAAVSGEVTHNMAFAWLLDAVPIEQLFKEYFLALSNPQEKKNEQRTDPSGDAAALAEPAAAPEPIARRGPGRPKKSSNPA